MRKNSHINALYFAIADDLHHTKLPLVVIAKRHDVSRSTVYSYAKKEKIDLVKRNRPNIYNRNNNKVSLYMTKVEFGILTREADRRGVTFSELIRGCLELKYDVSEALGKRVPSKEHVIRSITLDRLLIEYLLRVRKTFNCSLNRVFLSDLYRDDSFLSKEQEALFTWPEEVK